jgi:hypothetical protein
MSNLVATGGTKPYKAIAALVLTFLGTLYATLQGRTDLGTMGWTDWLIVIISSLVSAGAVYGITNPAIGQRKAE